MLHRILPPQPLKILNNTKTIAQLTRGFLHLPRRTIAASVAALEKSVKGDEKLHSPQHFTNERRKISALGGAGVSMSSALPRSLGPIQGNDCLNDVRNKSGPFNGWNFSRVCPNDAPKWRSRIEPIPLVGSCSQAWQVDQAIGQAIQQSCLEQASMVRRKTRHIGAIDRKGFDHAQAAFGVPILYHLVYLLVLAFCAVLTIC